MHICYVDESGCTGTLPSPTSNIQPALVIVALFLPVVHLPVITQRFIKLKGQFFPGLMPLRGHYLDRMTVEIKGSNLRRDASVGSRRARRTAIGFLDKVIALLEEFNVRVVGRTWIKGVGQAIDGRAIYTSAVQRIYRQLQHFATSNDESAFVIADSRNRSLNVPVAHSIFTQKHQMAGDSYDRVLEMPTFGHSDNHVGLQLADALASGLLFPMAMNAYCEGTIANIHVRPQYQHLKAWFGQRISNLQYRYQNTEGRWLGGLTVSDRIAMRPANVLFGL
ncbi:MAG: DUF3800 domain-containing protein [Phycisphaeraceae bacterium]